MDSHKHAHDMGQVYTLMFRQKNITSYHEEENMYQQSNMQQKFQPKKNMQIFLVDKNNAINSTSKYSNNLPQSITT